MVDFPSSLLGSAKSASGLVTYKPASSITSPKTEVSTTFNDRRTTVTRTFTDFQEYFKEYFLPAYKSYMINLRGKSFNYKIDPKKEITLTFQDMGHAFGLPNNSEIKNYLTDYLSEFLKELDTISSGTPKREVDEFLEKFGLKGVPLWDRDISDVEKTAVFNRINTIKTILLNAKKYPHGVLSIEDIDSNLTLVCDVIDNKHPSSDISKKSIRQLINEYADVPDIASSLFILADNASITLQKLYENRRDCLKTADFITASPEELKKIVNYIVSYMLNKLRRPTLIKELLKNLKEKDPNKFIEYLNEEHKTMIIQLYDELCTNVDYPDLIATLKRLQPLINEEMKRAIYEFAKANSTKTIDNFEQFMASTQEKNNRYIPDAPSEDFLVSMPHLTYNIEKKGNKFVVTTCNVKELIEELNLLALEPENVTEDQYRSYFALYKPLLEYAESSMEVLNNLNKSKFELIKKISSLENEILDITYSDDGSIPNKTEKEAELNNKLEKLNNELKLVENQITKLVTTLGCDNPVELINKDYYECLEIILTDSPTLLDKYIEYWLSTNINTEINTFVSSTSGSRPNIDDKYVYLAQFFKGSAGNVPGLDDGTFFSPNGSTSHLQIDSYVETALTSMFEGKELLRSKFFLDELITNGEDLKDKPGKLIKVYDLPFLFKKLIDSSYMMSKFKTEFDSSMLTVNWLRIAEKSKTVLRLKHNYLTSPLLKRIDDTIVFGFEEVAGKVVPKNEVKTADIDDWEEIGYILHLPGDVGEYDLVYIEPMRTADVRTKIPRNYLDLDPSDWSYDDYDSVPFTRVARTATSVYSVTHIRGESSHDLETVEVLVDNATGAKVQRQYNGDGCRIYVYGSHPRTRSTTGEKHSADIDFGRSNYFPSSLNYFITSKAVDVLTSGVEFQLMKSSTVIKPIAMAIKASEAEILRLVDSSPSYSTSSYTI